MTRPLDWHTFAAVDTLEQLDVLHDPSLCNFETREDLDLLPRIIQTGGEAGASALRRIASFGHRGWLDVLMSLEEDVYRHDLVEPWRDALEACVGISGPALGDRDILRALTQANIRLRA